MNDQELPTGWVATTLDSLCLPVDKVAPRKDAPDQPFTYLDITSIDNKTFRVVSPKIYMGREAPSRARQKVRSGNTLFSTVRTYLKNIAMVPPEFDGEVASTGFCVLNPTHGIDRKFIFYLVLNDEFISNLNPLQRGTSYPAVRNDDVLAQEIHLPPLAEQHRIVAAIEQHLTRLDNAVAALQRVQANLQRYRASVLKAACEGQLVPTEAALARTEDRDYEHADRLLARILVERRARWAAQPKRRARYKEPAPPDTSALPELPEGWVWATLGQPAEIQGGIQKQPKRRPAHSPYPYLRVANVLRGRLDLEEIHEFELFSGELEKLRLLRGDLLIVEGNGSPSQIGRMALWKDEIPDCVHQNHVIRARVLGGISPQFIESYWNSPTGSAGVLNVASSTSGLYTLSVSKVSNLPIPLPPLAEQRRIVAEVERRLSVIQQAETTVETSLQRAERLRQSILKQAFSGQLAPQDPNDEPAAVLMARIRKERAAAEAAAKARRKPRRRRARPAAARQKAKTPTPNPLPERKGLAVATQPPFPGGKGPGVRYQTTHWEHTEGTT